MYTMRTHFIKKRELKRNLFYWILIWMQLRYSFLESCCFPQSISADPVSKHKHIEQIACGDYILKMTNLEFIES